MTSPVSVIVPAHNEASGLPRLLDVLVDPGPGVEVIVVCNGCTDDTATVARGWPSVRVVEISEASKALALVRGDEVASHEVRAYVDADVVITGNGIRALVAAIDGQVQATSAERHLHLAASSVPVRWYYDVWARLPQVAGSIFGRGVVVLSGEGHRRVRDLPQVMSDDLAMAEAFAPAERKVVTSVKVDIFLPRTLHDLLLRRVRVATGVAELDQKGLRRPSSRTTPSTLVDLGVREPRLIPKIMVFLLVTLEVRRRARRRVRAGDFSTWLRDESSRT